MGAIRCGHEVAAQGQDQTLGRDAAAEFSAVSRLDGGRGIEGSGPKRAGAEAARHSDPCRPISLAVLLAAWLASPVRSWLVLSL